MNGNRILTLLAGVALLTALVPGAVAQTNTLGIGENDLRDEPNHPLDNVGHDTLDNGVGPNEDFPNAPLILEGVYQVSGGVITEDINNVMNRAQHGDDYSSYDSYIYPGLGWFEAYWGWWNDLGSGGSYQEDQVTADDGALPDVSIGGSPNGAIDDAGDDDVEDWDEFVWRGNNPFASNFGYDSYPGDELYAFIQPGSHAVANAWLPNATHPMDTRADEAGDPDFSFDDRTDSGGGWINANGFETIHHDSSLLITTTVTVSANPSSLGDGYDPHSGDRVDVDVYSTVDPAVESLYRTAVWDPGNQESSPTDAVHEEGVKGFMKTTYTETVEEVGKQASEALTDAYKPVDDGREPVQGQADDAVFGPFKHEPNTAQDIYPAANHDPETSYGGEPYYNPGDDQTYDYATEDHLWADAKATWGTPFYAVVLWAPFGWNADASMPGDAEHRSQSPGFLQMEANFGSWFDRNGDTWVGTANDPYQFANGDFSEQTSDDPYGHGVVDDPNQYYDANPEYTDEPEWYGTCNGEWKVTLTPNTPGEKWGDTGVYLVQSRTDGANTWNGDPTYDIIADTVGDTKVETPAGNVTLKDENGQLSLYRTEGPITLYTYCNDASGQAGVWFANDQILFPTGNLDYEVIIESTFTAEDSVTHRHGPDVGQPLSDETVVDVDILDPVMS